MHRPVLVTPPALLPISVEVIKEQVRIDFADDDSVIEQAIRAAVAHYEGWTGILGICLVEQSWRQDFDRFAHCLPLPLGPVIDIASVSWVNPAEQISIVPKVDYRLETDGGGRSFVRFRHGFTQPSDLAEVGAVRVEYKAGWPNTGEPVKPTVPEDICLAIRLRVQLVYDEAARDNAGNIERIEDMLVAKYRRFSI
ncbi:phage head-tail connector protein [Mesorhizobium sp. RMAD-H1]|uniref:head-tail connector protein n=1 Tax=Mesorhizobium sp. RMAD-H1 TaxID=2587065 RepID=UPI0016076BF0|nr:phage head-tail connector protein [Mesorhizobium sp. RMAD-H1]MBB2973952.1 putative phiE125 gp8 family phage protein [Mesorhizobium sp. RMAD-H1]